MRSHYCIHAVYAAKFGYSVRKARAFIVYSRLIRPVRHALGYAFPCFEYARVIQRAVYMYFLYAFRTARGIKHKRIGYYRAYAALLRLFHQRLCRAVMPFAVVAG